MDKQLSFKSYITENLQKFSTSLKRNIDDFFLEHLVLPSIKGPQDKYS